MERGDDRPDRSRTALHRDNAQHPEHLTKAGGVPVEELYAHVREPGDLVCRKRDAHEQEHHPGLERGQPWHERAQGLVASPVHGRVSRLELVTFTFSNGGRAALFLPSPTALNRWTRSWVAASPEFNTI